MTRDFKAGSVGMASTGSRALSVNDSQWFITKKDAPDLKNNYSELRQGHRGLDVVDKLVGCKPEAGRRRDRARLHGRRQNHHRDRSVQVGARAARRGGFYCAKS